MALTWPSIPKAGLQVETVREGSLSSCVRISRDDGITIHFAHCTNTESLWGLTYAPFQLCPRLAAHRASHGKPRRNSVSLRGIFRRILYIPGPDLPTVQTSSKIMFRRGLKTVKTGTQICEI
jgi:hypothetical protein